MMWLDALDLIGGFAAGVWVTRNYFMPVVTIKVTKLPPIEEYKSVKWAQAIEPVLGQLNVAAHLGSGVSYNAAGASAMYRLMRQMSGSLDVAVENAWAENPSRLQRDIINGANGIVKVTTNGEHT